MDVIISISFAFIAICCLFIVIKNAALMLGGKEFRISKIVVPVLGIIVMGLCLTIVKGMPPEQKKRQFVNYTQEEKWEYAKDNNFTILYKGDEVDSRYVVIDYYNAEYDEKEKIVYLSDKTD